jgi:1-acyl-sn-glycerol-3-phosphate acyltransferase
METGDLLARCFLAGIAVAPMVWLLLLYRARRYNPVQFLFWSIACLLVRLQWRCKLPSRLPLGPDDGAVIVANHRSSIDPFFIQILFDRPVHWFVAKEYFKVPVVGWFLRNCEAIPTNRGGQDTASVKQAIRYLKNGECVGLLPEGRINLKDVPQLPVRPGGSLLALQARVPLLPLYIENAPFDCIFWSPLLMTARTAVRVGRPIDMRTIAEGLGKMDAARAGILAAAKQMLELAGHGDIEPELAGAHTKPSAEEIAADHAAFRARKRAAQYAAYKRTSC